jgi:two-component system cell cycle response regulator
MGAWAARVTADATRMEAFSVDPRPRSKFGRTVLYGVTALMAAGLAVHVLHGPLGLTGPPFKRLMDYDSNLLMLASGLVCVARAVKVPTERRIWAALGVGMVTYAAGDISWTFLFSDLANPPYPSISDALWLTAYVPAYLALGWLIKSRLHGLRGSLWLDGLIGALVVAALAAAVILTPLIETAGQGNVWAVATNFAYPVLDIMLVGMVTFAFAATGWRPDRPLLLLGVGLAMGALVDSWYLVSVAHGTYQEGTLWDSVWPAAAMLRAFAAWQPLKRARRIHLPGARLVTAPIAFGAIAIAIETYDHFSKVNTAALLLTSVALCLGLLRLVLTFRENLGMLGRSKAAALTDPLTGLGNRRRMMAELERESQHAQPHVVALFDLNGFKSYNDTFGHPAGDELLRRLGAALAAAVEGHGEAFRMGGDEFCVLLRAARRDSHQVVAAARRALSETGDGFKVTSSYGVVESPLEASEASGALNLADRRLYMNKSGGRTSSPSQVRDVLLRALTTREPELGAHMRQVRGLALDVCRRLHLDGEALDEIGRAAELHDIGKVAIPDAILNKPGPLDEAEWAFMRRHTLIGEDILCAAPALAPVARLVRSSHERFDGSGYPDGLSGDAIPLGSRVIFACDAYDAMTSERPYHPALSSHEALKEMEQCAGTQFDPVAVEALRAALAPVAVHEATTLWSELTPA